MTPFVVGVSILAIGTSLPELVASVPSVRAGSSEIVAGNVLDTNAANLLLVLGAVRAAVPTGRLVLGEDYRFIDLHFLLGSLVALAAEEGQAHLSLGGAAVSRPVCAVHARGGHPRIAPMLARDSFWCHR